MFELDMRSSKPLYEQVVDKFKELIISQVLEADEKLPSVRELAQQLTINPNTIQKAYRELETQGLIYSVKGRGSFVNAADNTLDPQKLQAVETELRRLISEALYLGISGIELHQMIDNAMQNGGGETLD